MKTYESEIRRYIADQFLFGEEFRGSDRDSLLDAGIIDSTGVLELISHLETRYRLKVEDADLTPENLDTIERICAFVAKKSG